MSAPRFYFAESYGNSAYGTSGAYGEGSTQNSNTASVGGPNGGSPLQNTGAPVFFAVISLAIIIVAVGMFLKTTRASKK